MPPWLAATRSPAPTACSPRSASPPSSSRTYQRLRPQSGRELARVAAVDAAHARGAARRARAADRGRRRSGSTGDRDRGRRAGRGAADQWSPRRRRTPSGRSDRLDERQPARSSCSRPRRAAVGDRASPGTASRSRARCGSAATSSALVRSLMLRGSAGDLLWLRPDQWRGPREDRMIELVAEASRRAAARGRSTRCARCTTPPTCSPPGWPSARRSGCCPSCRRGCWSSATRTPCCPSRSGCADLPLVGRPAARRRRGDDARGSSCCGSARPCPALGRGRAAAATCAGSCSSSWPPAPTTSRSRASWGSACAPSGAGSSALMSELGADSRFQAGVEAARRGWI